MGIILVSSIPIDLLYRDEETHPIEDDVAVEGQEPKAATYYYGRPIRRYEPAPIAPVRRVKKHLYLVAEEQKKEED